MRHKGLIWTNHILHRMSERKLGYNDVYWVFKNPDKSFYDKKTQTWKYIRKLKNLIITVVATRNEKKEWILKTCWIKDYNNSNKTKTSLVLNFIKWLWESIPVKKH